MGPAALLDPREQHLMQALLDGLPLVDQPFAAVGAPMGLPEDEVLELLHRWLAQGRLRFLGPVLAPGRGPSSALERRLAEAVASGLPLVPRPFEALGAVLGAGGDEVRAALQHMQDDGRVMRIAALR